MPFLDHTALTTLNEAYDDKSPAAILAWAAQTFGDRLAVVTSFQPTGIVTLHLLREVAPHTPVLTLDTGRLFPETYRLIDEVERRFGLTVQRIRPALSLEEQDEQYGPNLDQRDPDLCCHLRKVVPLASALTGFDAWVSGLRRDQSPTRANIPVIGWDARHERVKLAPLAAWTESMIWAYIKAYDLPYNELHDRGYPSIGCWPCTQPVADDAVDGRAGRWAGQAKTECGLHLPHRTTP